MKVLYLVSYITILGEKEFIKNITGYGLMVRDIADYVSRAGVEVDVFGSSLITKGKKYRHFNILHRTWADIFFHLKPYYFVKMLHFVKCFHPSLRHIIRVMYFFLSVGYLEDVLRNGNYDLVHIHGIGSYAKAYIDCCERLGIRYLVTLHGLNSFSESLSLEKSEKQIERDFLYKAYKNIVPLTVISTGMLKVIKNYLNVQGEIDNFHVITNGTDVTRKYEGILDIRQKYSISQNRKIMLSVGNICGRKNQSQIVRAFALLPNEIKEDLSILFLGNDTTGGELKRLIDEKGFKDTLILCGNVNKNDMKSYYQQANFTILVSLSEGFGLSIIEGFVYGLPNLTFANLDAVQDLFDKKTMLTLADRSDTALADGITQMLSTDWDKEYIKSYAKNFSLEHMAQEYVNIYQKIMDS
jgi:glycosyltransferase involved in cell wall biosynthesis